MPYAVPTNRRQGAARTMFFSESAARWLLSRPEVLHEPWGTLRKALLAQFSASSVVETDLRRLMRLKKTGSMVDHVAKCRELRPGLPAMIPEEELIGLFVETLPEGEQEVFAFGQFDTFECALQHAIRFASRGKTLRAHHQTRREPELVLALESSRAPSGPAKGG